MKSLSVLVAGNFSKVDKTLMDWQYFLHLVRGICCYRKGALVNFKAFNTRLNIFKLHLPYTSLLYRYSWKIKMKTMAKQHPFTQRHVQCCVSSCVYKALHSFLTSTPQKENLTRKRLQLTQSLGMNTHSLFGLLSTFIKMVHCLERA